MSTRPPEGSALDASHSPLDDRLGASDEALASALAGGGEELLTLPELAERMDVSLTLLEAIEREGLLVPARTDGEARYTTADGEAVAAGLALLEAGVPLSELLDLARRCDDALRGVADQAVEVFVRFVRDPVQGAAASDDEAAARLLDALRRMLPATSAVLTHHFRRLLLASAQARLDPGEGP